MSAAKVIVTGGTGALGRAVVEGFLETGARVVVPWILKTERDQVAPLWESAIGEDRVVLIEADIAESEGAERVVAAAEGADVLVNAAGGFAGGSPHHETDLDTWDSMFRINVRTAAGMTRAVIPSMRARGTGTIILVASRAALERPAGLGAYSASKAAIMVLAETLQNELLDTEIRVNALVPTTIDTPANRAAMPDADFSSWTTPTKIAAVIRWLASDDGATVRGAFVPV